MATYYVRSGGSDGNTGLGAGTGQAWATIGKALGATGITGGDTVYIAAGTYREVVTIGGTYSSATYIYGDPTSAQFSGVTAGEVRITPSGSDNAVSTSFALTATSKNNLNFKDLIIGGMNITTSSNMTIERCLLFSTSATTQAFVFLNNNGVNYNTTIKQSVIAGTVTGIEYQYLFRPAPWNAGLNVSDCAIFGNTAVYINNNQVAFASNAPSQMTFYNCVIMGSTTFHQTTGYYTGGGTVTNFIVSNCLMYATGSYVFISQTNFLVENYNRIYGVNTRSSVAQGANTTVASWSGLEFGQSLLQGYGPLQIFGNTFNSPNATAGTASGAPAVDMYNQAWNVTPDIGVAIYRNIGGVGQYLPGDRNASTITIAPGSTSQSIELYLGATGLTASTSGLSAYYNRTRTASVNIPLVARTIAQAWTSGGFAEVDATNMPGVYRLDVPDAAVAAGADDVTIVVRGASGTNGAVMTVTLINEPTDAVLVRMGPYQIKADGLGSSQPLDINVGAAQGIDTQVVDANGSGVDITSATVNVKVYDSGGILVATYAGTATYAADGRLTFAITTAVTGTAGTYTATITRTTSASDTQIFGPLRLYVRPV